MDPCLDDCVMFAKRLKSLNNVVGLDVLPGLPHGFLNFVKVKTASIFFNKKCSAENFSVLVVQRSTQWEQKMCATIIGTVDKSCVESTNGPIE